MGKKSKKKVQPSFLNGREIKSSKEMKGDMKDVINEIERSRIRLFEADKRNGKRSERRAINRKEKEFVEDMDSIKCRKKIAKKWTNKGFLNTVMEMLKDSIPMVQALAKAIAAFVIAFLSIPAVQEHISPKFLKALTTVFDIAVAI